MASSAATGTGCGPNNINYVLGITKAYTTRVGEGPFPTELKNKIGELIGTKGKERLSEISSLLKAITKKIPSKINWIIQVEGHTDNVPISNNEFPSNWELSVARAIAVARIMIDNGIEPNRINVAGYGEFRPLVDNQDKDNRKKNRRIELKLTQP